MAAVLLCCCCRSEVEAANPIVPGVGMADPHMHVWSSDPDTVWLYSTHDCSRHPSGPCVSAKGELGFRMLDWWVWSSSNLVDWKQRSRVLPSAISWETNDTVTECWATDAAQRDGKTFFYLSACSVYALVAH